MGKRHLSARGLLGVAATAGIVALGACTALVGLDGDYVAVTDSGIDAPTRIDAGQPDSGPPPDAAPPVEAAADANVDPSGILSCSQLPPNCGPGQNESCCAVRDVPGGTFNRLNSGSFPATVSPFKLDRFEVTVSRFRAFLRAGQGTQAAPPQAGAAEHEKIAGTGWEAGFSSQLPADTDALVNAVKCPGTTWTDNPGPNENKPMTCLNWYVAFAFCAWDGARLPTEAEWNFAAVGGDEQRLYPWSVPPASQDVDAGYAVYTPEPTTDFVGYRSPKGDGKWGHADLGGNLWEWTYDYVGDPDPPGTCTDCAQTTPGTEGPFRILRGGSFEDGTDEMRAYWRYWSNPLANARLPRYGARCARKTP